MLYLEKVSLMPSGDTESIVGTTIKLVMDPLLLLKNPVLRSKCSSLVCIASII